MRPINERMGRVLVACLLSSIMPLSAADNPVNGTAEPAATKTPVATQPASEIEQLKQMLADQQRQIDELRHALKQETKETDGKPAAAAAPTPPAPQPAAVAASPAPVSSAPAAEITEARPSSAPVRSWLGPLFRPASFSRAPEPLPVQNNTAGTRDVPVTQLSNSISLLQGKLQIGATLYADWADYYKSGFGPQFLTQINQEGPGNNGFNSFDISRTYLNFLFSPNDNITVRITPNIYRQIAGGLTADKVGTVTAIPASADQNLAFRLKYAYVDFKNIFKGSPNFKGVVFTAGQLQNPLIDWEENLWTLRYVSLVPWNYLSLSSTQTGIALHGPITGSNGKTYLDFNLGIYTQASFHAYEQAESKQLMARASFYPFGSTGNYQGLGITGFIDYGRSNAPPETARTISTYRGVAMVHYGTKNNSSNIAFEYDFGRNAFSSNNLFSGSGPIDQFGLGTSIYGGMDAVIKAIQGTDRAKQQGFNVFGHLQLGKSPFTLFGWFETFQPNTEISKNPADFDRIIGGLQYRVNRSLRLSFDAQNLIFTHGQFTMPASTIQPFSSSLASANPNGIPRVVPGNLQAFFINMEFSF